MAELKRTFTSGRMNKDLDDRLVPNGEYIDALNIKIASSEASDVGAIENLLGNERLSTLFSSTDNAVTIGSIAYPLKNKIYWFVSSDTADCIYEYDEKTEAVSIVIHDAKNSVITTLDQIVLSGNVDSELVIKNYNEANLIQILGVNNLPIVNDEEVLINNNVDITLSDPYVNISIPKNTVLRKENDEMVFKNIIYDFPKLGNISPSVTYSSGGVLNFSKQNKITGINIIDDMLFWTDNINPPRRIYIPKFKKYSLNNPGSDTKIEYKIKNASGIIQIQTRDFNEDDISVAKKAPMNAPAVDIFDSTSGGGLILIQKSLNLFNKKSGDIIKIESLPQNPVWKVGDSVDIASEDTEIQIQASVLSISDDPAINNRIELRIDTIAEDTTDASFLFDIELAQKKALYELNFPRFAYRWKYKNGEYSTISPFSIPVFIPSDFKYDGKEAFNHGMINKTQQIVLKSFDVGGDDIEEIDILFKETKNNNIYVYDTKKKIDFDLTNEITIEKERIHSIIPNDQLLRAWDNIPKRAKSQEVTANRIIYGNYYQSYDVYSKPDFEIGLAERTDDFKRTIKSDRNYQIGVVYIDEYNRHTPVLTGENSSIKIEKKNAINQSKFNITLKNQPPAWAKYFKYYIKDTSGEYYNIAADRFYQDLENGFTYISVPSSDRNKVTNEHYLILKKQHGENEAVLQADNRYKIIDIFSEPPGFITNRKKEVYSIGDLVFTDDYSGSGGGNEILAKDQTGARGGAPAVDYNQIQIKGGNGGQGSNIWEGVPLADAKELKPGRFFRFTFGDKESEIYEIKSLQQHPAGSNEIKITVVEPFGEDVEIIWQKASPNNLGTTSGDKANPSGIGLSILEEYTAAGDKEFDGRFFIKLKTNATLTDSIKTQSIGGVSYLAKEAIMLNGIYPREYDRYRNDNNYKNSARYKNKALTNPPNDFVVSDGGSTTNGSAASSGKYTKFAGLEYNITLEQSTHRNDGAFDQITRQIKLGDFVRFKNSDGSDHHETVYEIGAIRFHDKKDQKQGGTRKRTIKCISIRFIDEDGEFLELTKRVCTRDQNTTGAEPLMEILQKLDNEKIIIKEPAIFETEPLESKTDLDIYFETQNAFPIEEHNQLHELEWYNAICFGNGVESNRIRDDFNATFVDIGVRASAPLAQQFKEEHKFNGIIWSGIINSRSGFNQSNQFNAANPITKDLLPSYGSIQKLFARDNDLVIYCEDKIVRALADKDILYNADGSSNLVASNRVIGNIIPFTGEYGISQVPESFAFYGFRAYNADPKRGVILRLSKDGITTISSNNMNAFFDDRLKNNVIKSASYDNEENIYNITFDGLDTVCFNENVNGWVTRKSYIPENALSLNSTYYSYNNGDIWKHGSSNVKRNNFYDTQFSSFVEFTVNDQPSVIKKFKTLGYEGTKNWVAKTIKTDQVSGIETSFIVKENKYFANLTQEAKTSSLLDQKNFSTQGIGKSVAKGASSYVSQLGVVSNTTATFDLNLNPNTLTATTITKTQAPGEKISYIEFKIFAPAGFTINSNDFVGNNFSFVQSKNNEVLAALDLNITQPTTNQSFAYDVIGKITKIPTQVKGAYSIAGDNFDYTGQKSGSYTVSGNLGTEKIINKRTITAAAGYFLEDTSFVITNTSIELELNKISSTIYEIQESVFINNINSVLDYAVNIIPTKIVVLDKLIYSKKIDITALPNTQVQRPLTISGQPDAEVNVLFSNSSSAISDINIKLDNTGKKEIILDFPAGNTAETYTIVFKSLKGSKIDSGFGGNTVTILRPIKSRKTASLIVFYSSSILDRFDISDYINTKHKRSFSIELVLPSGTYTAGVQPSDNNINFGSNQNSASTSLNSLTFGTGSNTHKVTVSGDLKIDNLIENETYTLDISALVGKNVTTTFDYDNNSKDGSGSGNYTSATTTYATTGGAGLKSTPAASEYYWTLTPSSGYLFKSSIDADDFEFLDASNNSVIDTYTDGGELLLRKVNDNLEIGFNSRPFSQPSANATFTIRPKNSTTLTETKPATSAPFVSLQVIFEGKLDDINGSMVSIPANLTNQLISTPPGQSGHKVIASATNLPHNTNYLYQAVIPIGLIKDIGVIDVSELTDANKFKYTEVLGGTKLAQPSAGSYNLFETPASTKSITSKFSYDTSTHELTINILVNLQSDATSAKLEVKVEGLLHSDKKWDGTTLVDKYHLISGKFDVDCTHQPGNANENTKQYTTNSETDAVFPKIWATDKNLTDNSKLYFQEQGTTKPGVLYFPKGNFYFIQKGNLSLYQAKEGIITKVKDCQVVVKNNSGIVTDPIGIRQNSEYQGFAWPAIYNDVAHCSFPLYSPLYKDTLVKITGEWVVEDYPDDLKNTPWQTNWKGPWLIPSTSSLTNYNIVKNQLSSEAGINNASELFISDKVTIKSSPSGTTPGIIENIVYFDKNGYADYTLETYRGKRGYKINVVLPGIYSKAYHQKFYHFNTIMGYNTADSHSKALASTAPVSWDAETALPRLNLHAPALYRPHIDPTNTTGLIGGVYHREGFSQNSLNSGYYITTANGQRSWIGSAPTGFGTNYKPIKILAGPKADNIAIVGTNPNSVDYNRDWPFGPGTAGYGMICDSDGIPIKIKATGARVLSSSSFTKGSGNFWVYNEYKTKIRLTRTELMNGDNSAVETTNYWEWYV